MIRLKNGAALNQWDINRAVEIYDPDNSVIEIECSKDNDEEPVMLSFTREGSIIEAFIPNIFLQTAKYITVFAMSRDESEMRIEDCMAFRVVERTKPLDYIYEETEIFNYRVMEDELKKAISSKADLDETGKIPAEQLPGNILKSEDLTQAVNTALTQAKESGEFKGEKGDKGDKGDQGIQGIQGEKGADGVSCSHSWNGTTLTVTSASGTSSVDLKGEKGDKGDRGEKGEQGIQGIQGIQGEKGEDGKDYILTSEDKSEIAGLIGGETIPDYWKDELEAKASAIQLAMEQAGKNKSAFLWYTDAHWVNGNSKVSPKLLEYLYMNTPMNKVNFGGDIIGDALLATRDEMEYLYQWRKEIRNLPNHHSVIGNHDMFESEYVDYEDDNYRYAFMIAPEETHDMVMGDGNYYYIDNHAEKTRYLYICYMDSDHEAMMKQGQFIADAISDVAEGWHIVAVAHRWWQYNSSSDPAEGFIPDYEKDILSVFDAYNSRVTRSGSNYFYAQDFTNAKGKVEFCIGGHLHIDCDFASNGGIPVIITASDTNQDRVPESMADSGASGTTTESSVYGIIADYNADATKITVVGIGRGTGRVIGETSQQPATVNLFDKTDPDMLDRGRINSSHVAVAYADNQLVTGFIEAKVGDTFTVKTDLANTANNYVGAAYCWDENKAYVGGNMERAVNAWSWNSDYTEGTFTIPSSYQFTETNIANFDGTAYIRFCLAYTDMDNIVITKNS